MKVVYQDIIQNTGDTCLTGMLIDSALVSLFQNADLEISVAGTVSKISNLYKIEAERVIAIYHQYRKMLKEASSQPQVVVQQQNHPDVLEQLEKLSKLKDAGILSEDEFNQKKAELLTKL